MHYCPRLRQASLHDAGQLLSQDVVEPMVNAEPLLLTLMFMAGGNCCFIHIWGRMG